MMFFRTFAALGSLLVLNSLASVFGKLENRAKELGSDPLQVQGLVPSAAFFNHVEIHWFAPFLSGGGYSSEAMAFAGVLDALDGVTSVDSRKASQRAASRGEGPYKPLNTFNLPFSVSFQMTHHGDSPSQTHIDGFTARDKELLEAHFNYAGSSPGGMDGRSLLPHELDIGISGEGEMGLGEGEIADRSDLSGGSIVLGGGRKDQKRRVLQIVICHSEPGAWHAPQPRYHTQRCPPAEPVSKSQNKTNRGKKFQQAGQKQKQKQKQRQANTFAISANTNDENNKHISFHQYRVGRTMFETDKVPSGWPGRLEFMHEVWVPTAFANNIFVAAMTEAETGGKQTVEVVQEPVDTDFYQPIDYNTLPADSHILGRLPSTLQVLEPFTNSGATIFLFVGKWEERKGIRMLIRAFYAFLASLTEGDSRKAHALLVIVTSAYHSTNQFNKEIKKILVDDGLQKAGSMSDTNKQYVLLTDIPQEHMPHLYSAATALVIPSTGEGWGRPHVESMSCGTPVVATAWSGPTAYLTPQNGYPLRVERMQPAAGWPGHHWAKPDEKHLVSILQEIHREYQQPEVDSPWKQKSIQARKDMVEKFSLPVFAQVMAGEIHRIERIAAARVQEEEKDEGMDFGVDSDEL